MLKDILKYSYPILIVSVAGMINLQGDKILMPKILGDGEEALAITGIYGASYKLALVMYIFTQGFPLLSNLSFSIMPSITIPRKYTRMYCSILPDSV